MDPLAAAPPASPPGPPAAPAAAPLLPGAPAPGAPPARAAALDLLRGVAIVGMVLSGIVPFGPAAPLPAWMYHAQVPPPAHVFNPALPGVTWVDLVFPFFLFALGAALPLALGGRLARGASAGALARDVVGRGLLLLFFAVFVQHVRPSVVGGAFDAPPGAWAVGLAGFACLWALFWRLPASWTPTVRRGVRAAGWAGAAALLALLRYPDGRGFRPDRYDIILVVLANMALVGGLLWLATRDRPAARLAALALLAAAILAGREPGWMQPVMDWKPLWGWFRPYYLKYLFLVVPGMAAGEAFVRWRAAPAGGGRPWGRAHAGALAAGGLALTALVTAGLFAREVGATAAGAAVALGVGLWATRAPSDAAERLVAGLVRAGAFWLVLGLVAEPFEGGIRKDPSTFSYYFVTGGLAHVVLGAFVLLGTRFGVRLGVLAANGQNPMLAYVALHNLVLPVLGLTGLYGLVGRTTPGPGPGFLRGALYTALTALVVWACTRRRWFWRT